MDNKENNMLVIQVGELIDGISNDTKKNISIIINGNSIVDIKPTGELAIPTGLDYKLIDYLIIKGFQLHLLVYVQKQYTLHFVNLDLHYQIN